MSSMMSCVSSCKFVSKLYRSIRVAQRQSSGAHGTPMAVFGVTGSIIIERMTHQIFGQ